MTDGDNKETETAARLRDAEETVRAIYQGAVDAIVVQGRDGPQIVTLSNADEPYRVLVDRMSDGALTVAPDGSVLYANQRLAEMALSGNESLVGRNFASLFTGAIPANYHEWSQPPAGGVRHEVHLARDGEAPLPVSVWAGPIALGEQPATLVTVTDLSTHRRAERIAVAERFARSILEQATDAIVVLSPAGRVTHASDAATALAGVNPIGHLFSEMFHLEPSPNAPPSALQRATGGALDELLASRPFHGIEVRVEGAAAADRTYLLSAGPLLDDAKHSVGSIVTLTDITARKRSEEQQTMLVAELNHRVKNILAIVQSIAAQTVRNTASLGGFNDTFGGRLRALSVAHDVLTKTRWGRVALTELLGELLAPYRERVTFDGAFVQLPSQTIVPLSMALHELMTNAAKYGALSSAGQVALTWETVTSPSPAVRVMWREHGGPAVSAPTRRGFGTMLIERVLAYDLEGTATLDFHPEGLLCTLSFPTAGSRASVEEPPASARQLDSTS